MLTLSTSLSMVSAEVTWPPVSPPPNTLLSISISRHRSELWPWSETKLQVLRVLYYCHNTEPFSSHISDRTTLQSGTGITSAVGEKEDKRSSKHITSSEAEMILVQSGADVTEQNAARFLEP